MIELTGTTACLIRDQLKKARYEGKIKPSQITARMSKIEIPKWLQGEIISMVKYRELDRCTCPVEQAMVQAVYYHIILEINQE